MRRFDLTERWAYWDALTDRWHGRDGEAVRELYRTADAIFNLCGATKLRDEHRQGAKLCYVETDPIYEQMRVANGEEDSIGFLGSHDVLFTYGELLGTPSCRVPVERFTWIPTRPPVVLDLWHPGTEGRAFTSIATWENKGKNVAFRGETYYWSKHVNFVKMIDVPVRAASASSSRWIPATPPSAPSSRRMGGRSSTRVRSPPTSMPIAATSSARAASSRWRRTSTSGRAAWWFSDRSVCFLAAGKPVITQETGFSELVPSGEGLLAFATPDEAVAAVRTVAGDWPRHARAARRIAEDHFAADTVIGAMLDAAGLR